MTKRFNITAGLFALLAPLSAAAQGPTLYLTSGDSGTLQAIDTATGSRDYITTTTGRGYPIAVRDSIWIGDRDNTLVAREHDLATGLPTGNTAPASGIDPDEFLDGTASPTNNYTVAFASRQVFVGQTDWSGLAPLFTISASDAGFDDVDGITYDTATDTLWFTTGNQVLQYDLAGNKLSDFPHVAGRGGLAYDAGSGTLWIVPNPALGLLHQYAKDGTLLDTVATPSRGFNVWGAEFQTVPEPGSFALLGLAGLAAMSRRRRR